MKITVLFSILLAPAAAGYCAEGELKTFPAAGIESLAVSAVAGPVSISGAGKGEITVALTGTEPEKCVITMKAEGSRLVLKAENALKNEGQENRGFWKRLFSGEGLNSSRYHTCRLGFTVSAPAALKVSAGSISGEVKVSGFAGAVKAAAVSGALTLEKLGAGLDAETVSGAMNLSDISGRVSAETTSGDIALKNLAGSLKAGSVSGDITMDGVSGDADARTVSGGIRADAAAGSVAARTVSGNISGTSCAKSLKAGTTSGKIDFKGLCGSAAIDAGSGNVSLAWAKLPSGGEAWAEAISGDVLLVFPADGGVSPTLASTSGRKTSEFSGAGFPVSVKTISGDISVLKAK